MDTPLQAGPLVQSRSVGVSTNVRHLRQVLLWPLRLMPLTRDGLREQRPWRVLRDLGPSSPWQEMVDEYTGDREGFHERHYNEFVTFLPYVQHFLYGEGRSGRSAADPVSSSPMRVFRRHDVAAMRVVAQPGSPPVTARVVHVDLYFFYELDVVLLNVETGFDDMTLGEAHNLLHRSGRGYPAGWDKDGQPLNCLTSVELLGTDGAVLVRSDMQDREAYLSHVSDHRSPRLAAHWAFLLEPLVPDHSSRDGLLRYRQIEYYRIPMMAYLAVDDPCQLTRNDYIRLCLARGSDGELDMVSDGGRPSAERHLADFEPRYCYDRFWTATGLAPHTRFLCSGRTLMVVGEASSEHFRCDDRGVLAQFRHQHFLLFLIAHLQKAALIMFSDRLVEALKRLDISNPDSVRRFKRDIRTIFASFLGFTHRYWFHDVSEQSLTRELFHLCTTHLGLDPLYTEVRERIGDMHSYLDADSLRRQANTVVRLTVVTILALIGTVSTGFLGMNLIAEAEAPLSRRILFLAVVFALTTLLTVYTVAKSKRLSDFLDALSDERLTVGKKLKALIAVWRAP
jgi:hypothetical protein